MGGAGEHRLVSDRWIAQEVKRSMAENDTREEKRGDDDTRDTDDHTQEVIRIGGEGGAAIPVHGTGPAQDDHTHLWAKASGSHRCYICEAQESADDTQPPDHTHVWRPVAGEPHRRTCRKCYQTEIVDTCDHDWRIDLRMDYSFRYQCAECGEMRD